LHILTKKKSYITINSNKSGVQKLTLRVVWDMTMDNWRVLKVRKD